MIKPLKRKGLMILKKNQCRSDMKITKADIDDVVTYNPETGDLIWKERTPRLIPRDRARSTWNTKHAGKIAGSVCNTTGHLRVKIMGHNLYVRRVAHMMMTGAWPKSLSRHNDGNYLNMRWSNIADSEAQAAARAEEKKKNALGIDRPVRPGIVYDSYSGRWLSFINLSKFVMINLGSFATDSEAIKARADKMESMGVIAS